MLALVDNRDHCIASGNSSHRWQQPWWQHVSLSSNESYHSDFPSLNGLSLEAQDFDLKQNTADECHCSVEGNRSEW